MSAMKAGVFRARGGPELKKRAGKAVMDDGQVPKITHLAYKVRDGETLISAMKRAILEYRP